MAEKRKKGSAVEFGDFDMDEATINRIKAERAESADRVARFNSTFVPTGSAFKDTSAFSGTSRDVKNMRQADLLLDKAADRGAVVRGQDIQLELGRGEIGVNTERNRINEKGIDVQKELGLGELDVNRDRNRISEKGIDKQFELGKGELNLNQDIFLQQAARYRKYGEPADLFALTERAANTKIGAAEAGLELSDSLTKETEKYLKGESKKPESVAAPIPMNTTVPEELAPVSRASIIGQYFQEGTGIANPYNELIPAIKQGREVGRSLRNYLFEPTIKRRAKKSQ